MFPGRSGNACILCQNGGLPKLGDDKPLRNKKWVKLVNHSKPTYKKWWLNFQGLGVEWIRSFFEQCGRGGKKKNSQSPGSQAKFFTELCNPRDPITF